jgi:hypothetical protein
MDLKKYQLFRYIEEKADEEPDLHARRIIMFCEHAATNRVTA